MSDETDTTSEVGDAIRELAHVVRTEDEIEGIALQVDDLWNRVQAHRERPKRIGRAPGTLYVEIEVTPHDWATRGETFDTWYEATPEQTVAALRREADRWAAEYGLPQIATQEPAGATRGGSGDSRASGGLGERLRALVAEPDPEESQYESVDVAALVGLADEAHRLEVHARVVEQSLRTARAEGDGARIKGAQWKARYEEARDANRRVLEVAQWLRGQGLVGYARKVEEAVGGMEGALNADHPLGKVIGVIRECGTEYYKPEGEHPLGRTAGELFGPSGVTLHALETSRITFAPELQAELNEQIDQWGKRLGDRVRAEMGLAPSENEVAP